MHVFGFRGKVTAALRSKYGITHRITKPWHRMFLSIRSVEGFEIYFDRGDLSPFSRISALNIVGLQTENGHDIYISDDEDKYSITPSVLAAGPIKSNSSLTANSTKATDPVYHFIDTHSVELIVIKKSGEKLQLR